MNGRKQHNRRGQVMVLTLLGITLLGSLVFYVVNVGDQVNRKVVMQNSADAAVISGAAWFARSANVVGMNNVAQTRMLALVPILDSFPLSTKMAFEEATAWEARLREQLTRGVPDAWIAQGLESLRARMDRQARILEPLNQYLNYSGFDMKSKTTWAIPGAGGPPPNGMLWQAAESLDEMGQATAASAGVLSQANAVRYGVMDKAESAFIVPVVPTLPARRTAWADYERPIKTGNIPDRAYPQRLGPYDRLFKWRDYHYRDITEPDHVVPGQPGHGAIRGGGGNINVTGRVRGNGAMGSSTNPNDHWVYRTVGRVLMGYTIYGPYEWMIRRINGYAQGWWHDRGYYPGELADTFFHEYQKNIADIKLGYMWGAQAPRYIHYAQWHTDYPAARAMAADPNVRVNRTMFYKVEIRSRFPKNASGWLSAGSFKTNGELPIAMWVQNWVDPASWVRQSPANVRQIADYIWEDKFDYETTEDWDIGIRMQYDATGRPVWQKVYMVSQYVFGGVDTGGDVEVTNPANFSDANDLPAPILMDLSVGDYDMSQPHHDLGVRRNVFTFMGVSRLNNEPLVWANRFRGSPFPAVVGLAQAEIFNTTSWDFWTQDWKVKLVPMALWSDWMQRMQDTAPDADQTNGLVDMQNVLDLHQYLSRFDQSLVNVMMQH